MTSRQEDRRFWWDARARRRRARLRCQSFVCLLESVHPLLRLGGSPSVNVVRALIGLAAARKAAVLARSNIGLPVRSCLSPSKLILRRNLAEAAARVPFSMLIAAGMWRRTT